MIPVLLFHTELIASVAFGVAVFILFIYLFVEPHFVVEAVEKFGPNVLGFQLATGARRWYIVGVYIAPEASFEGSSVKYFFQLPDDIF